ncbi:MAG: tetratricopeptide repeat protein [Anaerolineae bacterium]|nr:tetratricopeptide repeat protein [Anaerolineae bacterium]
MTGDKAVRIYNKRGQGRLNIGDYAGALGDFNRALLLDPTCAEAYQNRGLAYRCQGELDNAIADFSRALRYSTPSPDLTCRIYYHRAMTRLTRGDLIGALDDLSCLIAQSPTRADAYISRGDIRQRLGDLAGAISDFSEALRIDPELDSALIRRGNAYRDQGRASAALADYSAAITLCTAELRVYVYRGQLLLQRGELQAALADFEAYLRWGGGRMYGDEASIAAQIEALQAALLLRPGPPPAE